MKIRTGFVSNSSSSSFVLDKEGLTLKQIQAIQKWVNDAYDKEIDDVNINETDKHFFGTVSQHLKPSLGEVLEKLHIDKDKLEYGD